jgi:hypothetical protein
MFVVVKVSAQRCWCFRVFTPFHPQSLLGHSKQFGVDGAGLEEVHAEALKVRL